jgi:hypothetical protein
MRLAQFLCAAALLWAGLAAAAAELDLNTKHQVAQLIVAQRYGDALALLLPLETQLSDNPDFNYLLGLTALKAGDSSLAQSSLERVVLQKPNFAGAWLDLALACEANGDLDGANKALLAFKLRFATPPALRPVVASLQERLDNASRGKRRVHGELSLSVGHDSNANNGFAVASLPLTIGGIVVELPLDPSLRPRSASFAETALTLQGPLRDDDALNWYFSGRDRRYQGESPSNLGEYTAGLTASRPLRGDWFARLDTSAQRVQLGQRRLFDSAHIAAQIEHPISTHCSAALGSEYEKRRNAPASGIEANLAWLYSGVACQSSLLPGLQWNGLLRVGRDDPADNRAGGQTQRQELYLQAGLPLGSRFWLDGRWQWSRAADQEGYSPLIANDINRVLNRTGWQLALSSPLTPKLRATASIEDWRQRSNIPLFEQNNTTIKLGLSYLF